MWSFRSGIVLVLLTLAFRVMGCPWAGTYTTEILGATAVLVVTCPEAGHLHGELGVDDYPYVLQLTGSGDSASGTFIDPAMGGVLSCRAMRSADTIDLFVGEQEEGIGVSPQHWRFVRGTAPARRAADTTPDKGARDPRLVGAWTYSESYTSGDFSFATQWHLILGADGTLEQTGRTVGGGPEVSGDSGEGEVLRARWRTHEGVIEVDRGEGYQQMARYICDGGRVMFTMANGDKQVWTRE